MSDHNIGEGTPSTKVGQLLLMSGLTFHSGRRLADHPELLVTIEAEARTAALTALRERMEGIGMIGSAMPWPALCAACGMRTEDPDAYESEDADLMDEALWCDYTARTHRWADYRAAVLAEIDRMLTA